MVIFLALVGCSENEFNVSPPKSELADPPPATPPPAPTTPPPTPPPTPSPDPEPEIEVSPLVLDFGVLPLGQLLTESFVVTNTGQAVLHVTDVDLSGDSGFAVATHTSFDLAPNTSETVEVAYYSQGVTVNATATVMSDDSDEPEVDVSLLGEGIIPATPPDLRILPADLQLGSSDVPCTLTDKIDLTNVGGSLLTVSSLSFTDPSNTLDLLVMPTFPLEIPSGESYSLDVVFSPTAPVTAQANLSVISDDPDGIETSTASASADFRATSDTFVAPPDPPIDIIFVVDQSGSMDAQSANMAAAINDLIAGLNATTSNWRVGVATYDNGCLNADQANPSQHWIDATSTNSASFFQYVVGLGYYDNPNNLHTEQLFAVAGAALQATAPGGCNADFRRPDGFLHIVAVSDEAEQSDLYTVVPPYTTVAGALGVYNQYVASPSLLKFSAVANVGDCNNQNDWQAQGYDRYQAMTQQTGGLLLDICGAQWGSQMSSLGAVTASSQPLPLSETPYPATLTVSFDGLLQPAASFTYDSQGNAVIIDPPAPPGTSIEVDYAMEGICP